MELLQQFPRLAPIVFTCFVAYFLRSLSSKSKSSQRAPSGKHYPARDAAKGEFSMQVEYSEAKRNAVSWTLCSATAKTPIDGMEVHSSANNHVGRQVWMCETATGPVPKRVTESRAAYQKTSETIRHSADEVYRSQCEAKRTDTVNASNSGTTHIQRVAEAVSGAAKHVCSLQETDGHWPGDYGGPMFLLPGLLIACYRTEVQLPEPHRLEMLAYIFNHQNSDGGLGLHIEGESTMFGTTLNYIAARILGAKPTGDFCIRARKWIVNNGGAYCNTSWAKFWMCVMGVYEWEGLNPLPPEMWLLPDWFIIHPRRFWCHTRMVYLPMSYIYGSRASWPVTGLVQELRTELYAEPYESIDWSAHRNDCAGLDLYVKHSWFQDFLWSALYHIDSWIPDFLRAAALRRCLEMIHYEDEDTYYVNLGPVNKAMNMLCCSWEDPDSESFQKHIPRIYDYLWLAEDGMKMQGYNGSQSWDVSFAVQAMCTQGMTSLKNEAGREELREIVDATLTRSQQFLDASQNRTDPQDMEKFYKHTRKGSWPFSTMDNGWPVSDCSAEGLRAVIDVQSANLKDLSLISLERQKDCVDIILSYQNTREHWGTGGWATYENRRGPFWLELLNPSECFGDIVVDYDYVELTSACIVALHKYVKKYPDSNTPQITEAIAKGAAYIRKDQKDDGSWYGSWGVCFTYGVWFGVNGLATVGDNYWNSKCVQKAVAFLLDKQMLKGGWGESYLSSSTKTYHNADERQYVNTAWAMLAIMDAVPIIDGCVVPQPLEEALERAANFLIASQMEDGDWKQQLVTGVFNHNCMITYANYRNVFPLWALSEYYGRLLLQEGRKVE